MERDSEWERGCQGLNIKAVLLVDNEVVIFDYDQIDTSTAEFLRRKENNMREIVGKTYTELGRELYDAQQKLARQGSKYDGVFEKWYTSIGFKRQKVYDLINRFNLLRNMEEDSEHLEDLPVSLTYKIAKPSAESTESKRKAKQAVLNGEVKTLKEYRELEKALRQANEDKQVLGQLLTEERNKQPEVEYVIDPDTETKLKRYEELFGDQSIYDGDITRVTDGDAITYAVFEFSEDMRKLIEKYSYLTHYANEFNQMIDEGKEKYTQSIHAMFSFLNSIERNMNSQGAVIINE